MKRLRRWLSERFTEAGELNKLQRYIKTKEPRRVGIKFRANAVTLAKQGCVIFHEHYWVPQDGITFDCGLRVYTAGNIPTRDGIDREDVTMQLLEIEATDGG